MKEKRYFCDYWWNDTIKYKLIGFIIIILSFLVIASVSSIINYNVLISKYGNSLNSYSESAYQLLDEIADNAIQEGIGIDLLALPDDVVEYEISSENDEIIFKFYLDNNKDMKFAVSASMIVELSDNFEVISRKPNFSSKEEYISGMKSLMIANSILWGVISGLIFVTLGFLGGTIAAFISNANKNKNLS